MCSDSKPYAVVAVYDNLTQREASDQLEKAGFRVFEASHFEDAKALIEHHELMVELLFTDNVAPASELGGSYLAQYCEHSFPHIRILSVLERIDQCVNEHSERAASVTKSLSMQHKVDPRVSVQTSGSVAVAP